MIRRSFIACLAGLPFLRFKGKPPRPSFSQIHAECTSNLVYYGPEFAKPTEVSPGVYFYAIPIEWIDKPGTLDYVIEHGVMRRIKS